MVTRCLLNLHTKKEVKLNAILELLTLQDIQDDPENKNRNLISLSQRFQENFVGLVTAHFF